MGKYLDSIGLSHLVTKIKSMFTANVHITDENIDLSTTPSSGIYHRVIQIDDANGDCIGWVQAHQDENGAHGISIGTNDLNDPDGTTHQIMLSMNGSTPGCWVSQAASVRSGIGAAASSHSHGSITNAGAITSDTTAASGDKLVISDSSDSSKLKRSSIAFGTNNNTFLRKDGTWATPQSSVTLEDLVWDAAVDDGGAIWFDDADVTVGGPLPIWAGGTGASTAAAAKTNLGLTSTYGQIPITNSPVNGYSDSTLKWQRFGNVVSGYFACKLTASISAWNYARLGSSGSLPAPEGGWTMYWPCMQDGNGSTQAAFNLGSTGIPYLHMRGGTGASGNVYHGSFCYVCANGA